MSPRRPLLALAFLLAAVCSEPTGPSGQRGVAAAPMDGRWVSTIAAGTFTLDLRQTGENVTGTFTAWATGAATSRPATRAVGTFTSLALTLIVDPPVPVVADTTTRASYLATLVALDTLDGSWQDRPTLRPVTLRFVRQH